MPRVLTLLTVLVIVFLLTAVAASASDEAEIIIDNSPEAIERDMEQRGSVTAPLVTRATPTCANRPVIPYEKLQRNLMGPKFRAQRAAFSLVSSGAVYELWTGPARRGRAFYSVVLVMLVPAGKAACLVNAGFYPVAHTHDKVGI